MKTKTIKYVVGFMFDKNFTEVLLVRKQRPEWQCGLLNGIGGHVEDEEHWAGAMEREFKEETGIETAFGDWERFCEMSGINNNGEGFEIVFFWGIGAIQSAIQADEPLEVVGLLDVHPMRGDTIGDLPWLIAMARDCGNGVHPPQNVIVKYGRKS